MLQEMASTTHRRWKGYTLARPSLSVVCCFWVFAFDLVGSKFNEEVSASEHMQHSVHLC